MKHHCVLLLTALVLVACSAPEPSLASFTLHRPSSAPPAIDFEHMDQPVWSQSKSGDMVATGYVTVNNSQNADKASAWIRGDPERMELCYHIPYYTESEMPPLKDPNIGYAAAAWIVPIDFHVRGLTSAPKQSALNGACK